MSGIINACGTASNWGKRPDFTDISMGMSQQEVIEILGKPEDIEASGNAVYLNYMYTAWYDHNGADGTAEFYFVRLIDNQVESYGRRGDRVVRRGTSDLAGAIASGGVAAGQTMNNSNNVTESSTFQVQKSYNLMNRAYDRERGLTICTYRSGSDYTSKEYIGVHSCPGVVSGP